MYKRQGKYCCCAHSKDHSRSCKSFLHRLFPPSCWLLLCLPDDISIMENLLVVNSQNNSLYGTFFCYFYIIWIFLRHICTIFFYLYFKWIILFFSCIINPVSYTHLPAPITHPSPMVTPPQTTTLDASQQLSFIVIGFAYSRL